MAEHVPAPPLLLIVREQLRPGAAEEYAGNEREIAAVCARFGCPHPYLALAPLAGSEDVWWLNAFASEAEKDRVEAAYARNEPLTAALRPLAARKHSLRQGSTTTLARHRGDSNLDAALRLGGARFFAVNTAGAPEAAGSVFETAGGQRLIIASADSRPEVERLAALAAGSVKLAVQPQWSYPADAWIAADPEFWDARRGPGFLTPKPA